MRILIANTLFPPVIHGGAEVSTGKLAQALVARGHDVHVVTMSGERADVERRGGMTIHHLPPYIVGYPYGAGGNGAIKKFGIHAFDNFNPAMYRRLRSIMRAIDPDVLHSNVLQVLSAGIWSAARAEGVPILHNLRDYWLLCARSGFFRNGRTCAGRCADCRLFTAGRRYLSADVDGVVAVGQHVLDTHLRAGLFGGARVARAILSATERQPGPPRAPAPAAGTITLGFIGRIKESKGLRLLLQAWAQVPPSAGVRLVVAGSGADGYMDEMKALADDRVTFLGWCASADFYRQVDVVVVPSLYPEPLPRSVLESYSYGLPVIAAASGGTPEVVAEGQTGWLYQPLDSAGLAARIRGLRGPEGLAGLSPDAIAAIVARTDPDHVVDQYEDAYRRVIG